MPLGAVPAAAHVRRRPVRVPLLLLLPGLLLGLLLPCGALARAPAAWAEMPGALQPAPVPAGGAAVQPLRPRPAAPPQAPVPAAVGRVAAPARVLPGLPGGRRGPVEVRDEWLLAQPRLTLPALSPDPLGRGRWRARVAVNRGNDFGWAQTQAGELPEGGDRRFLVDGEHQTTEASLRYGLCSTLDVAVRVPLHWRGGGFMDSFIDTFHEAFAWAGFLDNDRPAFDLDRHRIEGRDDAGVPFSWSEETGVGLGRVELATHWAFAGAQPGAARTFALVGRLTLPTASGPFEAEGLEAGLQALCALRLRRNLDLYVGVGGTWFGEPGLGGVTYERTRAMGFVALEWRPAATWSLLVEVNGASRLVTSIALYPALQTYVNLAARVDLGRCWQWEVGCTENITDQQATTDFGAFTGLVARF
ncbi:MAG: DUF3187 family protein [Planctomycetia bacterium]